MIHSSRARFAHADKQKQDTDGVYEQAALVCLCIIIEKLSTQAEGAYFIAKWRITV